MCNPSEDMREVDAIKYLCGKGESKSYLKNLTINGLENLVNYYRREELKTPVKVLKCKA